MKLDDILRHDLVGRKLIHINRYGKKVTLEIEDIKTENHSEDLEESTQANDWWPKSREWTTTTIKFIDGSSLQINPGYDFEFAPDD